MEEEIARDGFRDDGVSPELLALLQEFIYREITDIKTQKYIVLLLKTDGESFDAFQELKGAREDHPDTCDGGCLSQDTEAAGVIQPIVRRSYDPRKPR